MRAFLGGLAVIVTVGALTPSAVAGYPFYPYRPQAPDACGQGYYAPNEYGQVYGPNYCLQPPFAPFNGCRPALPSNGGQGSGANPALPQYYTHPFARSPRDYFMYE